MAETKQVVERNHDQVVVDRAKDFWGRYGKIVMIASTAVILLCGGYLAYKYLVKGPNEEKAVEAMFKAEEYYRLDSLKPALNGDGLNAGFLKIINNYGGTKAGNLARFYAGDIYLKTGDFNNAVKYLKDFSTDAKQVQARAYKLLGDAYAEQGKNSDALASYKKAADHFEKDDANSSEYLFMAAYFADRVMKDRKGAIELYKELKEKYSRTEKGFEAEKYLAQLGVYSDTK
jgi:predicted negative regulator of RcsB-dependent stress response